MNFLGLVLFILETDHLLLTLNKITLVEFIFYEK